jgi:hypothetical protein
MSSYMLASPLRAVIDATYEAGASHNQNTTFQVAVLIARFHVTHRLHTRTWRPNLVVEWLAFLLYTAEVPVSNLDQIS